MLTKHRAYSYPRMLPAFSAPQLVLILSLSLFPRLSRPLALFRFIATMSAPENYARESLIATLAVRRAAIYTQKVFHSLVKGTVSKDDRSPVTIGDFGAQALIIAAIRHNFPDDEIAGEEESSLLRSNLELRHKVWKLVSQIRLPNPEEDLLLGGPLKSDDAMLDAIDGGKSVGGDKGRFWALDPIDGTLGFLRGGQYAVCLALIQDGEVVVGAMGCPNLPINKTTPIINSGIGEEAQSSDKLGIIASAIVGHGAIIRPLSVEDGAEEEPIRMRELTSFADASFCEGVETAHSSHIQQKAIADRLGIVTPSVRLDSASKYVSIARGSADIYLRLPKSLSYEEKIWDHAAGYLIAREAGGEVTDATGKKLDFGKGRTLVANKGIVAAPRAMHEKVLEAVRAVREI
jgi:3'(2'), 5'-bisphosphate nucleotidase